MRWPPARPALSLHEIAPVTVKDRKGETIVTDDEEPGRCDLQRIPTMRPAFAKDGTVTAATSSSISDGAASLLLMSEAEAKRRGLKPLARIVGQASHAQEPAWFTTAPGPAVKKAAGRAQLEGRRCRPVRDQRGLCLRRHWLPCAIWASRTTA